MDDGTSSPAIHVGFIVREDAVDINDAPLDIPLPSLGLFNCQTPLVTLHQSNAGPSEMTLRPRQNTLTEGLIWKAGCRLCQ